MADFVVCGVMGCGEVVLVELSMVWSGVVWREWRCGICVVVGLVESVECGGMTV